MSGAAAGRSAASRLATLAVALGLLGLMMAAAQLVPGDEARAGTVAAVGFLLLVAGAAAHVTEPLGVPHLTAVLLAGVAVGPHGLGVVGHQAVEDLQAVNALALALIALAGGASALLVFPSAIYAMGQRPEMAIEHFKRIADVTDLPLIAFQYPASGSQGYPLPTLLRMLDAVPSIRAIKDWCGNAQLADRQIRALQTRNPPVNVLSTHSAWLFSSLVLGCNGLLSGSGSVIADLQAQLFQAVRADDLATARRVHERIYHTAEVFYADPPVDMHNRMKEALVLMGKLPRAVVRPPLVKISAQEIERIRQALISAQLLAPEHARRMAA
jgi:4-hydroxy-tetrahydrodipicolinate synthase